MSGSVLHDQGQGSNIMCVRGDGKARICLEGFHGGRIEVRSTRQEWEPLTVAVMYCR